MKGRAKTPEQKRAVVERLLAAWLSTQHQRLGQLIFNATSDNVTNENYHLAIFNIEDSAIATAVEALVAKRNSND